MPTLPTADQFLKSIATAASGVLGKDVTTISGFAESQWKQLATYSIWVGEAILEGDFTGDDALRENFLQSIQDMAHNLVETLMGLAILTVEKTWNAIVNVIWTTLDNATGLTLPRPI
jgi:hypothetical protein